MDTASISHGYTRFWSKDLPREISYPQTSLYCNLAVSASRYPDKTFLIFYDTPLTYGDFSRQVDALAGYLQQECGVHKGDRVILYLQSSPQFMVAFYAVLRADAVVVPVNPMNLTEELRQIVVDSGARVGIVGQELIGRIAPLADACIANLIVAAYSDYVELRTDLRLPEEVKAPRAAIGLPRATCWQEALASGCLPRQHASGPDELCVIPYTSGTTGRPKGCMHSHRTAMATSVCGGSWAGLEPDTVTLCSMPLFHITGMQSGMNGPIYLGQTVVLMQRWDRDTAARLIERYRVWSWNCISTMAVDFLANPGLERYDLSSLRRISGGGASMPESVARRLFELTGLDYIEGYGLTETMAPSHVNPRNRPKRQCLGIPLYGVDSRVIDPDTLEELAPGQTGEIIIHGPQVFLGYWNNPNATDEAFVEIEGKRFFRTGDIARCDEDGYFFMTDRLKRMINASGMKVWPAEVERMLYAHPAIQEACVIAARDAYRGETVKALVLLQAESRGAVTSEDVIAWCRTQMASYKVPRIVEFVERLPKSATGKIQWRLLQEREMEEG